MDTPTFQVNNKCSAHDFSSWQVLLAMSSFMTPMDARSETNGNRVRMFSLQNLSESVRTEKWDRIKVVCRQQFSRHLQYGLSFIVVHTTESKKEVPNRPASPVKVLGRFALKDEDDSAISVGSFFTRRKDLMESPLPSAPASSLTGEHDFKFKMKSSLKLFLLMYVPNYHHINIF